MAPDLFGACRGLGLRMLLWLALVARTKPEGFCVSQLKRGQMITDSFQELLLSAR